MVVPFYRLVDFPHCPSWPAGTLLVHFEVLVSAGMGRERREMMSRDGSRATKAGPNVSHSTCVSSPRLVSRGPVAVGGSSNDEYDVKIHKSA